MSADAISARRPIKVPGARLMRSRDKTPGSPGFDAVVATIKRLHLIAARPL